MGCTGVNRSSMGVIRGQLGLLRGPMGFQKVRVQSLFWLQV